MFRLRATATFCRRRGTVAQLDGVPAIRGGGGGFLSVGRRLNIMSARPRPAFFRCETAAVAPALLRRPAATGMILTGKRLSDVLVDKDGQRDLQRGEHVGATHAQDTQAVSQTSPEPKS